MNDDAKSLLRMFGCLPTALGAGLVLLGAFYFLMEWRFAGVALFLALVWGLMLVGLGLVIMATGRAWTSLLGVAAAASSALLVYFDARGPYFNDSFYGAYAGDGLAIALGVAMTFVARSRRTPAAPAAPRAQPPHGPNDD